MANIKLLTKKVRIHEYLSEALRQANMKEIEMEISMFLFAKMTKSHENETVYHLNMKELQNLTGHSYNLKNYIDACKRLREITFVIDREKSILVTGLLNDADFIKGKATVEVTISRKLKPYLMDLFSNYTEHQLFSMLRLKSKHSKKIYMYLCQNRPIKGYIRNTLEGINLKTFKEKTGYINSETGEEIYTNYGIFNQQALKIAKKEINEVTDIRFAYKPVKWGREVVALDIDIENKKNDEIISSRYEAFGILANQNKSLDENLQDISDLERLTKIYGLSQAQAEKVLKKLDRPMLFNELTKVDEAKKANNIKKSVGAYSVQTINNKFANILGVYKAEKEKKNVE
jgi:plasmid replication initiation protein